MEKKFQPVMDFPAYSKNSNAVNGLFWLMESNVFDRLNMATIVVFQAFTIESYLNHLGYESIKHWEEIERLPWRKKIEILHKTADIEADWGVDPLQFAVEVLRIRDKMAHGKPETVLGGFYDTKEEALSVFGTDTMEPEWYRKIDKNWLRNSKVRFSTLMEYLAELIGNPKHEYQCGGTGKIIEV